MAGGLTFGLKRSPAQIAALVDCLWLNEENQCVVQLHDKCGQKSPPYFRCIALHGSQMLRARVKTWAKHAPI